MPPIRSLALCKPVKTERTHEENQERAYIAASRRSDRSLEARVESARRASEIHKRRTGRSLRVTEQDVVNEEMYEEEDDDLPMQYRRLTAHLQTSNAEFDRRLAAYLTNHVAMRTALGQAVNQGGGMYPNAAQFANSGNMPQMQNLNNNQQSNNMGPPRNSSNAQPNRQATYPAHQGMKQAMHSRSASFATPNSLSGMPSPYNKNNMNAAQRRNSVPVSTPQPGVKKSPTSIANLKYEVQTPNEQNSYSMLSPPKSEASDSKMPTPQPSNAQQLRPSEFPAPFDMSFNNQMAAGLGSVPFSTALPPESQQLLGGAFDVNDPMTAMLLGPDYRPDSFYNYDASNDKSNFAQGSSFSGMSQTLAPSFLDTSVGGYDTNVPNSAFTDGSPFLTSAGGFGMGFDQSYNDAFKPNNFSNSGFASGEVTPSADKEWQSLINGSDWEDQSSTQV